MIKSLNLIPEEPKNSIFSLIQNLKSQFFSQQQHPQTAKTKHNPTQILEWSYPKSKHMTFSKQKTNPIAQIKNTPNRLFPKTKTKSETGTIEKAEFCSPGSLPNFGQTPEILISHGDLHFPNPFQLPFSLKQQQQFPLGEAKNNYSMKL